MRERLIKLQLSDSVMNAYLALYRKYATGSSKISNWESIRSPDARALVSHDSLPAPKETRKALAKLAVCKLNGGLGTSMGCSGAKSLIVVKEGKTFLELIVEQLSEINEEHGVSVPVIFMNSFYTHEETQKVITAHPSGVDIHCFQQNKFPRLRKDDDSPLVEREFGGEAWYPPGHGDLYYCLQHQEILDKLLHEGREVLFVSNADNLGAVIDMRILSYMLEKDIPFLMEVTEKTPADVKGGTLYLDDGLLRLLEVARVPEDRLDEFYSLEKFKIFNTNNIWINLVHLKKKLAHGALDLEVIANQKTVAGVDIVQLETAVGSALDHFPGAKGLLVGRERFLPVKKTDDLLLIQSDLYLLEKGCLVYNSGRVKNGLPRVKLGTTFSRLEDYFSRFRAIPRMLELNSLTIDGDVFFEGDAVLKGDVTIIGGNGRITIPQGSVLEDYRLEK